MAIQVSDGYRALREDAAAIDLSARGRIRITGEDRARLLHAMCSNDVQRLKPGQGCYAFFLNAQGRILADAIVLAFDDHLLLSTEPELREFLREHLDKYIIADDVALEDVTVTTTEIAVEGPRAQPPAPLPEAPYSHVRWGDAVLVRASLTGQPGYRVINGHVDAMPATPEDARTVRIENGIPRYGEDITDKNLVHETQRLEAVNFSKGCYLGQEIVERVRSRGGVHRFLVRLEVAGEYPPAPGTRIVADGKDVGEVTSAVYSPALARVAALGYARLDDVSPSKSFEIAGRAAALILR